MNRQVPRWEEMVGAESARVAAQIFQAFRREKREFKRSDATDFIHAMYLPHADLWRGDKAFSDLLIKHKVNYSGRIVPTLADLPARIAAAHGNVLTIAKRASDLGKEGYAGSMETDQLVWLNDI